MSFPENSKCQEIGPFCCLHEQLQMASFFFTPKGMQIGCLSFPLRPASLSRWQYERSPKSLHVDSTAPAGWAPASSFSLGGALGRMSPFVLFRSSQLVWCSGPRWKLWLWSHWLPHAVCGISVVALQPHLVNLSRLQACVCPLRFREQSSANADRKGHYGRWCSHHLEWLQLSGSEMTHCAEESFL